MSSEVTKWDYHALATYIAESAAEVWEKRFEDGQTAFDRVAGRGEEGWELVSVCPILSNGSTRQLLFVFKRPRRVKLAGVAEETPTEEALRAAEPKVEDSESPLAEDEAPGTLQ